MIDTNTGSNGNNKQYSHKINGNKSITANRTIIWKSVAMIAYDICL